MQFISEEYIKELMEKKKNKQPLTSNEEYIVLFHEALGCSYHSGKSHSAQLLDASRDYYNQSYKGRW